MDPDRPISTAPSGTYLQGSPHTPLDILLTAYLAESSIGRSPVLSGGLGPFEDELLSETSGMPTSMHIGQWTTGVYDTSDRARPLRGMVGMLRNQTSLIPYELSSPGHSVLRILRTKGLRTLTTSYDRLIALRGFPIAPSVLGRVLD